MGHATVQARQLRARQRLDVDHAPDVPLSTLEALEQAARRTGLPLGDLELLGQTPESAQGFVSACQADAVPEYLESVDWDRLEAMRQERYPVYN